VAEGTDGWATCVLLLVFALEFGCKLVAKANGIRKDGSAVEYTDFQVITHSLC